MPFVSIPEIHTANPSSPWVPKNVFRPADPFSILMHIRVSSDIVQQGHKFDAVFQMVNPRKDPYGPAWFTDIGDGIMMDTIDTRWFGVGFDGRTDLGFMIFWNHYSDATLRVLGGEKNKGIFLVRGTIDIPNTELFAHSPEFWYKVRP